MSVVTIGKGGSGPFQRPEDDLYLLEQLGIAEDTLVVFTSDNGGDLPDDPREPPRQAQQAGLQVNGPYRGDKHSIWQGGFRVPFIARWPGEIPAGTTAEATVSLVDLFSTVTDVLTGEVLPPSQASPDGYSFREALLQEEVGAPIERPPLVQSNVDGIRAVREGKWKYIEGEYPEGMDVSKEQEASPQARRQRRTQPISTTSSPKPPQSKLCCPTIKTLKA